VTAVFANVTKHPPWLHEHYDVETVSTHVNRRRNTSCMHACTAIFTYLPTEEGRRVIDVNVYPRRLVVIM